MSPIQPIQRAKRLHRISIGTLGVAVMLLLLGTIVLDMGTVIDRILYAALTAAALFFMFATMNVMIHKSA